MNRVIFSFVIAALGIFPPAANAQIFRRGCNTCYAAPKVFHHAPAVVKQPDFLQTFVFNNISPPGDLSPRGDTVYGVSRALEYNSPNSALYLDNARRALEVSSEFTSAARGVDADILAAATVDAQGRAVEAAFRALKPDITARSTTTTIRLRNGIPEFTEETPVARGGFSCAKCHTGDGAGAKRYSLDGPLTLEKYLQGKEAIESGSMPPKPAPPLSESEKAIAVLRLGRLVEE